MAIELHHLNTHGMMKQACDVLDGVVRLKERIAELEKLNHDLCERVTENDEIRLHWEEIEQTRAENERMKARIAELEKENESLKYSVATLETDLDMSKRWRKFSEEKPKEMQWILVFVENPSKYGTYIELRRWDIICKFDVENQELYTKWMPLPSAPEEEK